MRVRHCAMSLRVDLAFQELLAMVSSISAAQAAEREQMKSQELAAQEMNNSMKQLTLQWRGLTLRGRR